LISSQYVLDADRVGLLAAVSQYHVGDVPMLEAASEQVAMIVADGDPAESVRSSTCNDPDGLPTFAIFNPTRHKSKACACTYF
jgi:hypothetical protein